jgi:hypothetical protein
LPPREVMVVRGVSVLIALTRPVRTREPRVVAAS